MALLEDIIRIHANKNNPSASNSNATRDASLPGDDMLSPKYVDVVSDSAEINDTFQFIVEENVEVPESNSVLQPNLPVHP